MAVTGSSFRERKQIELLGFQQLVEKISSIKLEEPRSSVWTKRRNMMDISFNTYSRCIYWQPEGIWNDWVIEMIAMLVSWHLDSEIKKRIQDQLKIEGCDRCFISNNVSMNPS